MTIIDKRKSGGNSSVNNRQRFIKRYKQLIKDNISEDTEKGIKDGADKRKVKLSKKNLTEPEFSLDSSTGKHKRVMPGNKQYQVGDGIRKNKGGQGKGNQGSQDGEGEDDFSFVLTRQEFIDIYFEDMALPSFVKQSLKDNVKYKMTRSGFSKDGIPPRLDLLKTFKQAIARRIATREDDFEPRFLDELDLRYRHFTKKPYPIVQAHVFFLMDVSGSMDEQKKGLAKKFFLLLYLFLEQQYEKIEITFVRHTQNAEECTEQEFFYDTQSGGTMVSEGLKKINDIIDERVDLNHMNVYVAQASDGDNWAMDDADCVDQLTKLIQKVQYFVYVQIEDEYEKDYDDLYDLYKNVAEETDKLNLAKVSDERDVFPALKSLFKKE